MVKFSGVSRRGLRIRAGVRQILLWGLHTSELPAETLARACSLNNNKLMFHASRSVKEIREVESGVNVKMSCTDMFDLPLLQINTSARVAVTGDDHV
jgi:hypothetical protein